MMAETELKRDWKLAPALGLVTSGNQRWRSDSPLTTGGSTAHPGNLSKHIIFISGKSEPLNFYFLIYFFLMQFKACISSPAHHGYGNRPHAFPWYVLLLCPIFLFPFSHVFSSADWPTQNLWFFLVCLISRLLLSPGHSPVRQHLSVQMPPKTGIQCRQRKGSPSQ